MMNSDLMDYSEKRKLELDLASEKFDFASEMQKAARNPEWRNKLGLWTLLSAACNEAASKCFDKISNFAKNLIDIETCNVKALKSIANEVDLGYLVKNINVSQFPSDIADLIDILSLSRKTLLDKTEVLSQDANDFLYGEIAKRSASEMISKSESWTEGKTEILDSSLLYSMKEHSKDIEAIFNANMVYSQKKLSRVLKHEVEGLHDKDSSGNLIYKDVLEMTIRELFEKIESIDLSHNAENFAKMQFMAVANTNEGPKETINWFYILVNVIRQTYYNEKDDVYIIPSYFNKLQNIEIDLTPLFANIINKIASDNDAYIRGFICWHFYELICSKLKNKVLKSLFTYSKSSSSFICNEDAFKELSEDSTGKTEAFTSALSEFLNDIEISHLLNPKNCNGATLSISSVANSDLVEFRKILEADQQQDQRLK